VAGVSEDERLGRALRTIAEALGQDAASFTWYVAALERMGAACRSDEWRPGASIRVDAIVHTDSPLEGHECVTGLIEHVVELLGPACDCTVEIGGDDCRRRARRDRLAERLASALTRNESLIEQRDAEKAINIRSRIDAAYGRALLRMIEQSRRLRRFALAGRVPFDMSGRYPVVESVKREIAEVLAEERGSDLEADEIVDVLATVVQLFIGTGRGDAAFLEALDRGAERLATRLDAVDDGLAWDQAKARERENG